jgi:hypothetical protein
MMDLFALIIAGIAAWDGDALCPELWRWRIPDPIPGPDPGDPWPISPAGTFLRRALAAIGGATIVALLGWRLAAGTDAVPILLVGAATGMAIGSLINMAVPKTRRAAPAR